MNGAVRELLRGSLSGDEWPLCLRARLGDLRPRFIPKSRLGTGHRAIARNGRVLLASDLPVEELSGRTARVRLQTWHRRILPGAAGEPYGVLICIRCSADEPAQPLYDLALAGSESDDAALSVDVGGQTVLLFRPLNTPTST